MDELIEKNMGLVISIVNSFGPKNHTERDDLIDAGRIALWKALQKYDATTGNKFSTYAWRPIVWAIIREIKYRKKYVSWDGVIEPTTEYDDRLWECFTADMSEDELEIIDLRCQGYKFREICEKVGESPSIVKNKFYKVINRLQQIHE